jgi:hypothetical protein
MLQNSPKSFGCEHKGRPSAPYESLQRKPTQKTISARANPLVERRIARHVIHRRLGGREDSPPEDVCLIYLVTEVEV